MDVSGWEYKQLLCVALCGCCVKVVQHDRPYWVRWPVCPGTGGCGFIFFCLQPIVFLCGCKPLVRLLLEVVIKREIQYLKRTCTCARKARHAWLLHCEYRLREYASQWQHRSRMTGWRMHLGGSNVCDAQTFFTEQGTSYEIVSYASEIVTLR